MTNEGDVISASTTNVRTDGGKKNKKGKKQQKGNEGILPEPTKQGQTSPPFDSTHGRRSRVTCHHLLWTAHTVKRRRAWHAIIAFGQHTRSNDSERGNIIAFVQHKQSNDVQHGMS